jgi:hypothetical protein
MRRNERVPSGAGRSERRFWGSLALAMTLHGGVAWVVHREGRERAALPRTERLDFFELSMTEAEKPDVVQQQTSRDSVPAEPAVEPTAARAAQARTPLAAASATTEEVSSSAMAEQPAPQATDRAAPTSSAAPAAGLSLSALGIGSNPFVGLHAGPLADGRPGGSPPPSDPKELPDPTHAAERRLEQSMVSAMLDHDRAVGASRSGPVVTALEEAAMLVASPTTGQAEFVATIDAQGLVAALRAVRVSSSALEWQRVADQALKKLAKKRVRVPAGSAGLEVRLLLSSRIQLPSGASAGGAVALHQVPLTEKGEAFKLSRLEPLPGSGRVPDSETPGGTSPGAMRQPLPVGGLDFDLADVGGISRRVVHVAIASERPL